MPEDQGNAAVATEATPQAAPVPVEVQSTTTEAPAPVTTEAQATATEAEAPNINDLPLGSQVDDVDPEADADAVVLPPEHLNPYTFRLKLGKKGVYGPMKDNSGNLLDSPKISVGKDGTSRPFFVAEVEAYIVSEDPIWDGTRVFSMDALMQGIYLTSLKDKKTGASAASDVANKTGYPFQRGATIDQNADHMRQLLSAEPTIKGIIQWQAAKETGETDDNGYAKRVIAKRGEKNFPPLLRENEQGQMEQQFYGNGQPIHNPRMEDPQDGSELVARAVITRFLPVNS